jgi:hypothetical protein
MASGEVGWFRAAPPFFPLFQPLSNEDASISFSSKSCTWRAASEAACLASGQRRLKVTDDDYQFSGGLG